METEMKLIILLIVALSTFVAPSDGSAQAQFPSTAPQYPSMAPLDQYLTADRNAEIALARSAAPTAISSSAEVLVLTRRGYETAVKGTNGFVCLVDRGWQAPFADPEFWNHKIRAPVCLNPQAARSVLPITRKRTELALAGLSQAEILARFKSAIDKKELGQPELGAMSYMMSKDQYLGDQFQHWHPHVMFYMPGAIEGASWGANALHSPVVLGPERLPDGTREPVKVFVVPVAHWSDGTPATGANQPSSR
jgi:hypothetical protein